MSQEVFNEIDPSATSGTELADILNDFKDALMSGLKGPSRPTQVVAGGTWIDDSVAGILRLKIYTGTTDITVFTLNLTTSTVSIQNSDDFFEITKVSEDAIGPYLSFFKKRLNDSGQVESGDTVGEIVFKAIGQGGGTQTIGRVRYITTEDVTPTNSGAYYVIEGTRTGQASMTEFMRLLDGKVSIGAGAPQTALHVRSTTGIKNERISDDTTPAKDIIRKARSSGLGQVLSADELSSRESASTDVAGTEFTATRIVAKATENHTAAARGSSLSFETINNGSTSLLERMKLDTDGLDMSVPFIQDAFKRKVQTFASVAEVLSLDAQRSFVEVTGTTAMTLKGISSTSKSKSFYLYNATNQNITIINQAADVPATDRIAVNGEVTFTLQPGKSVEIVRRDSISRWSPLIEGNTGITFNEATFLLAKLIANSWIPEIVVTPTAALSGTTPPVGIGTNGALTAVIGHGSGGVRGAMKAYLGGSWGISAALTGADWIPGSQFQRVAVASFQVFSDLYIAFMSVRSTGTNRIVYGFGLAHGTGTWAQPEPSLSTGNSNSAMTWRDVATDGLIFMCVASAGAQRVGRRSVVATSDTWTYVSNTVIDVPLYSVSYGAGRWVAVGGPIGASLNHAAWVSTNGTTWTSYAMPNEATVTYNMVRYCNNNFVAIGGDSSTGMVVLTSVDGTSWIQRYTADVGVILSDVGYSNGLYLISSLNINTAIVSTDGVNFTAVKGKTLNSMAVGQDGQFVAVPSLAKGPGILQTITPNY